MRKGVSSHSIALHATRLNRWATKSRTKGLLLFPIQPHLCPDRSQANEGYLLDSERPLIRSSRSHRVIGDPIEITAVLAQRNTSTHRTRRARSSRLARTKLLI